MTVTAMASVVFIVIVVSAMVTNQGKRGVAARVYATIYGVTLALFVILAVMRVVPTRLKTEWNIVGVDIV